MKTRLLSDLPSRSRIVTGGRAYAVSPERARLNRNGWPPTSLRLALLLALLLLLVPARSASAAEDWTIQAFNATYLIRPDGSLDVQEAIDADFGRTAKHGIFRDLSVRFRYDDEQDRIYRVDVLSVTDAQGQKIPYETSTEGATYRIKIGDPDRTVAGLQTYRIHYTLRGALNSFPDHDELFWNVSGTWPVPIDHWSARVVVPGVDQVACFQGETGSRETCPAQTTADGASFQSNRPLVDDEQFTIVVGFAKGYVPNPTPILTAKERDFVDYFLITPLAVGAMLLAGVGAIAGIVALWWLRGRDRRYTTMFYLTQDPTEERRGLFERDQVVIEYEPPNQIRPGQVGVLIDERADLRDMTATIVDLAVRRYLTITELPEQGILWAKKKDWLLDRQPKDAGDLLEYESRLLRGLFSTGDSVKISDLRNTFYKDLNAAQSQLYKDVARRNWFIGNPETVRAQWVAWGILAAIVGAGIGFGLGYFFGGAIVGIPLVLAGMLIALLSGVMPRRSALGSELLRRTAGFREFIATAEKDRQRFNEQANIFAEFLPYAMAFGLVDRWVRAFRDVDVQAATGYWYVGHGTFDARHFDQGMQDFTSVAGAALASTPGSSGGSGFSGGSSGGGGGGGGGGSW